MKNLNIDSIYNSQKTFYANGNTISIDKRIEHLKKLRAAIYENENEIFEALSKDLNKNEIESYSTELGLVYHEIDYFISHLHHLCKPQRVATPLFAFPAKSKTHLDPLGTVLIIAPWNYPFQLLFLPLVGAIAAGNTVVLKPSEISENTSIISKKIIETAFPNEYIALLNGDKNLVSELLEYRWDLIFYTGSTLVGKIIYQAAAKNLTPVVLELGGKSPCIVDEKSDIKIAAKRIVWGKLVNAGQTCIAPDYILIHKNVKDKFILEFEKNVNFFYSENPIQSDVYGKIINQNHFDRLKNYLSNNEIIYGGKYDDKQMKIAPTLLSIQSLDAPIMQEEIFGPLLPLITLDNIEDSILFINKREKPLSLYIFTNNIEFRNKVIDHTSSGGICVNDCLYQIANSNFGFGGVGHSGIGSYHGKTSLETFSHKKSIMYRANFLDLDFRYPPYKKYSLRLMKKILKWTM